MFALVFQSPFQTVQLTAAAEIDTYNPQIFVIEENTVTVSAQHPLHSVSLRQAAPFFICNGHSSHLCVEIPY